MSGLTPLLPCPFCGRPAMKTPIWRITCSADAAKEEFCPGTQLHLHDREWNTRAPSQQWQPIETAPKDGSYCDLWVVGDGEDGPGHQFRIAFCWYGAGQWRSKAANPLNGYLVRSIPTHWVPLLGPPANHAKSNDHPATNGPEPEREVK
jgi:hypothetical protein